MIDSALEECHRRALLPDLLVEVKAYQPPLPDEGEPAGSAPFTVPFDRNPRFVGREAELTQLHRLLQEGPTPTGGPPAIGPATSTACASSSRLRAAEVLDR